MAVMSLAYALYLARRLADCTDRLPAVVLNVERCDDLAKLQPILGEMLALIDELIYAGVDPSVLRWQRNITCPLVRAQFCQHVADTVADTKDGAGWET